MSTSKNVTKDNFRIIGNIEFSGDIKPIQSGLHDLGSIDKRFRDIYLADHLDGNSPKIHFGDFDFSAANVIEARDAAALATTALQPGGVDFSIDVLNKPTTLAGYGITDSYIPGELQATGSASLDGSAIISTVDRDMVVSGSGIADFRSDVLVDTILTVTDTVYLSGSILHQGDITPHANNIVNIGSESKRYKEIHLHESLHVGEETFNEFDIGTIRDVQNGAYATAAQGALADTALQPDDNIVVNNISLSGHLLGPATMVIDPEGFGDITGKVIVLGDLQVEGVTTTINSTNVAVSGKMINLSRGSATAVEANGSGLYVAGADATFKYMAGTNAWTTNRRMGINSGGSSTATLHVKQSYLDATNHDPLHIVDLTDTTRVKIDDSFNLMMSDSSGGNTIIKNNGRIGLGTINPAVSLHVDTTDAVMIPRGTNVQRPLAPTSSQRGYLRYNTELERFEGFSRGDVWRDLETISDADGDTYISTDAADGTDDDTLKFFTDNTVKLTIDSTGKTVLTSLQPSDEVLKITSPTPSISLNDNTNAGDMHIQWQSSIGDENGLRFFRDDVTTPDLVIDLTGNIGINLTEPQERLHLNDANIRIDDYAQPMLQLFRNENSRGSHLGHDSIGAFWRVTNNGDTFTLRDTNNTRLLTMNPNTRRVGIMDTAPDVTLHINTTDAIKLPKGDNSQRPSATTTEQRGYIRYNTELDRFEGFGSTDTWSQIGGVVDVDRDTYISAEISAHNDDDNLRFYTAGAEQMRINSQGDVGIGTNNPDSPLHIVHNSNDRSRRNILQIFRAFTPVAAGVTQQTYEKSVVFDSRFCDIPANSVENGYRIALDASCYIADTNFKGYLEQNYGIWARAGAYHNENDATQQGTGTINNSYAVFVDCLQGDGVTINNSYGIFQAANYTDDPDESKNYFESRVGVGVDDPAAKLHVIGPGTIAANDLTNSYILAGTTANGIGIDRNEIVCTGSSLNIGTSVGNTEDIHLRYNGTNNAVTVDGATGRVGINTSSPEEQLTVDGDIRFGSTGNYNQFTMKTSTKFGVYEGVLSIRNATIPGTGIAEHATLFATHSSTTGSTRHDVLVDGKVGIGHRAPGSKLDVRFNENNSTYTDWRSVDGIRITNESTVTGSLMGLQLTTPGSSIGIIGERVSEDSMNLHIINETYDGDPVSLMEINSSGAVGIRKSPSYALDVYGTAETAIRVDTSTADNDALVRFAHQGTNHFVIGHEGDTDKFVFHDNITSTHRMTIDSSGRVGINQYNPGTWDEKLSIVNNTSFIASFTREAGTPHLLFKNTNDTGTGRFYMDENQMQLSRGTANGSQRTQADVWLHGTDTGRVGVGNTSPGARLDVQPTTADRRVTRFGNDVTSHYVATGQNNHTLTFTCDSYYQAEVVITAHQTNSGNYNNLYVRGIWSNNYLSHNWDETENVGGLTGSEFVITNTHNGGNEQNGKLIIQHNFTDGSFSRITVRITDFFGSHEFNLT